MLGASSALGAVDLAELVSGATLHRLFLLAAVVISLTVLAVLGRPREWYARCSDRLIGAVPWGTLLVIAGLIGVYAGLQDGFGTAKPIVLPFRAWSYLDPRGILIAGFAHANTSHLVGNVLGTLVFGAAAESIWGHYTTRRDDTLVHELWTHPVVRAVVIFPAAVAVLTVVGAAIALGPIIGFSMVVFGFAGFTLVRYPLLTVVAGVGQTVLGRLVNALQQPELVTGGGSGYSTPWFASIAIQAHAVGLLIGVLLGLGYYRVVQRSRVSDASRGKLSPPSPDRVWIGVLLFGVAQSLWAIYWYRGADRYVLYRAVGVGLVFLLAALLTYAVVAREEPLLPRLAVSNPQSILADMTTITHSQLALLVVIAASAFLVSPAIAANATTVADADLPGDAIEVRGYELTYGENVTDGQINVFDIQGFGETTQVNTSGVIVRNTDRHIWSTEVSRGQLATSGSATVRLGGLGWQDSVTATRAGWQAVGGDTTYRVSLTHENTSRVLYTSNAVMAEPIIAGQRLSVNATEAGFRVASGDETVLLPRGNESATLGRLELTQQDNRLVAIHNGSNTAVRVATKAT